MILQAIGAVWALFLGIAFIMLANGLQNTLLGVRANLEAFPIWVTGLIMAGYFMGFLLGSLIAPRLVKRVGHVRVFAALASLASVAVLVHALFIEPVTWMAMRLVTGFSFAGLYIVAESWLNDRSTNDMRGAVLSLYMIVVLGGMGGGQALLLLADPGGFELFIIASVLVSLALVPMLLSASPAPHFDTPSSISVIELYQISPLGVVGAAGTGLAHGALFGLGAVYAREIGLGYGEVAIFMGLVFLGGVVLQFPIGRASDRFDRRLVLLVTAFAAALAAAGALLFAVLDQRLLVFACMAVLGGTSLPLYALVVSHTNDYLRVDQMVAASSTIYLMVGIGATLGPIAVGLVMTGLGPDGFFLSLLLLHAAIGGFAAWRMTRRPSVPLEEQGAHVPLSMSGTGAVGTAAMVSEARSDDEDEHGEAASQKVANPDN